MIQVAIGTIRSWPKAEPDVAIDMASPRRVVNQRPTIDVTNTGEAAASPSEVSTPYSK
jgi:hypothetical protein